MRVLDVSWCEEEGVAGRTPVGPDVEYYTGDARIEIPAADAVDRIAVAFGANPGFGDDRYMHNERPIL